MTATTPQSRKWRVGSPRNPVVLLGRSLPQVVAISGWAVALLVLLNMQSHSTGERLIVAAAVTVLFAALAFGKVADRFITDWLQPITHWAGLVTLRRRRWVSSAPLEIGNPGPSTPPLAAKGWTIAAPNVTPSEGANKIPFGVFWNAKLKTYVGVAQVENPSWFITDDDNKIRRIGQWGRVLGSFADFDCPINHLHLISRSGFADQEQTDAHRHYLAHPNLEADPDLVSDYFANIKANHLEVDGRSQQLLHEVYVAWQITAESAAAQFKDSDVEPLKLATGMLWSEIERFAAALTDLIVTPLSADGIGHLISTQYNPFNPTFTPGRLDWPTSTVIDPDAYHTDNVAHITQWAAEISTGPILDPGYIGNWLTHATVVGARLTYPVTFATVMAFTSAEKASKRAERRQNNRATSAAIAERQNSRETARERAAQDEVDRLEQELADNNAEVDHSSYVTVTAPPKMVGAAAKHVAQLARNEAGVRLQPMARTQDLAFTATALPTGMGRP